MFNRPLAISNFGCGRDFSKETGVKRGYDLSFNRLAHLDSLIQTWKCLLWKQHSNWPQPLPLPSFQTSRTTQKCHTFVATCLLSITRISINLIKWSPAFNLFIFCRVRSACPTESTKAFIALPPPPRLLNDINAQISSLSFYVLYIGY